MKTAILIGATGLVGSNLLDQLLSNQHYAKVIVFTRRTTGHAHGKLEEHIIDFDKPATWKGLVKGDVLFSCLGTTISKAGSKDAQYKIDFTYQYQFAKAASENGVGSYVLISAAGANANSRIFYNRMKGELEQAVLKLTFRQIYIIQPGLLAGQRTETRIGEKVGFVALGVLSKLPGLTKFKPINGATVAKAMVNASLKNEAGVETYTLAGVFNLAGEKV